MLQKFSIDNIDEFFYKQKEKTTFSKELNHLEVEQYKLDENIKLFKAHKSINYSINVPIKYDPKGLFINIMLDGKMNYESHLSNFGNKFKNMVLKNQTYLTLMNQEEGTNHISKDTSLKSIILLIKNDFLDQNILNNLNDQDKLRKDYSNSISNILSHKKTSLKTSMLANEIFNSPFEGGLNSMFLQSKAYEIMYHEFKDLICQNNDIKDTKIKFSKEDIAALHLAKSLITQDNQYLSLTKLSRAVALNEFKLKVGFRKLFNISVGNMVIEQKMYQSKKLLEDSELNISEISRIMGYKYPSNFTTAFVEHFSKTPSEVMKNRKYYY